VADDVEQDTVTETYGDCGSDGEARVVYGETHICARCAHAPVCTIAEATENRSHLLVAVSRCLMFQNEDVQPDEPTTTDAG